MAAKKRTVKDTAPTVSLLHELVSTIQEGYKLEMSSDEILIAVETLLRKDGWKV